MKSAFFDVSQGAKEYVNSDKRSCCASAIQSFPAPRLRLSTPTGAQEIVNDEDDDEDEEMVNGTPSLLA
ncbi:MAG: hypothetical protein IJL35_06915 [Bacteroidaceae bacterium]|nr:hypothetical protein [Bacteroidaceae bacterium]